MGTHSKKETKKKNDSVGNNDNNVAKVNTTSYANAGPQVLKPVVAKGVHELTPAQREREIKYNKAKIETIKAKISFNEAKIKINNIKMDKKKKSYGGAKK
tara:strand:+ start:3943 stop:4242 length:300 start_codon:yes stop_codon:yes gene_type:complete